MAHTYRPKSSTEIIGKKKLFSPQAALIFEHMQQFEIRKNVKKYKSEIVLDPKSNFANIKIPRAVKKNITIPLLKQEIINNKGLTSSDFTKGKVSLTFGDGSSTSGGSGTRGGSEVTALAESLQCYYNSYYFMNGVSANEPTFKDLKKQEPCCFTDRTLETCWNSKLVESWIDDGVFIKIAKELKTNPKGYWGNFTGKVTFHRGSKFMKDIYKAKKKVHNQDKELAAKSKTKAQAPGSFNDDKWNPGDIWMTNIPNANNADPFAKHTCNWGSLNKAIEKFATDGKILGVSLKRVNTKATSYQYNKHGLEKHAQKYLGFTFGAGKFFNSKDCYLYATDGKIQFRATDVEKNWQGEIGNVSAAGGKLGGGNVNFFLNDVYKKEMWGPTGEIPAIRDALTSITTPNSANAKKFVEENWKLYESLISQQRVQDAENPKNREDWEEQYAEKDHGWRSSKYLCMKMLEVIYSDGSVIKRDHLMTLFYLYAASNTDQSSYFVKIAD